jgi:methylmalonyl-CoA mutase
VLALLTDLDDDQRSRLSVDLGADPLTAPLSGRPRRAWPTSLRSAKVSGYGGGVRAITVDGPAFHNLGASASWELAGSVARRSAICGCSERGLAAPDALRQISFPLRRRRRPVHDHREVARARQLWARVAEVVGEPRAAPPACTRSRRCR